MKSIRNIVLALLAAFPLVSSASIADQLLTLENTRVAITNAIVIKGGTASGALTNVPNEILALPTGGGGGVVEREIPYPDDWPVDEIKAAYSNDTENFSNFAIVLLRNNGASYSFTASGEGSVKTVFNDGTTYTSSGSYQTDGSGGYVWAKCYNNAQFDLMYLPMDSSGKGCVWFYSPKGRVTWTMYDYFYTAFECFYWNYNTMATAIYFKCLNVTSVRPSVFTEIYISTNCTSGYNNFVYQKHALVKFPEKFKWIGSDASHMFEECYALTSAPDIEVTATPDEYGAMCMFKNCCSIKNGPSSIDLSKMQRVDEMFSNCYSMETLPDVMDFSSVTSAGGFNNTFNNCISLKSLPTHMVGPNGAFDYTISFAHSSRISKQSLAVIEGGAVTGGLAYYINDVTNGGGNTRTIILPSNIRAGFSSADAALVISAFNAKGWSLGNFAQ